MTYAKFLSLSQNASSSCEFAVLVQKMNSLLKVTTSHKDPCAVHECIEGGRDQVLFKRCVKEKADKITHADKSEGMQLWMDKVKRIDDKMRSYHEGAVHKFEAQSYSQRNMQHNRDNRLADPSCHTKTFPFDCPASSSAPNMKCSYPPNLTNAEWTLLKVVSSVVMFLQDICLQREM